MTEVNLSKCQITPVPPNACCSIRARKSDKESKCSPSVSHLGDEKENKFICETCHDLLYPTERSLQGGLNVLEVYEPDIDHAYYNLSFSPGLLNMTFIPMYPHFNNYKCLLESLAAGEYDHGNHRLCLASFSSKCNELHSKCTDDDSGEKDMLRKNSKRWLCVGCTEHIIGFMEDKKLLVDETYISSILMFLHYVGDSAFSSILPLLMHNMLNIFNLFIKNSTDREIRELIEYIAENSHLIITCDGYYFFIDDVQKKIKLPNAEGLFNVRWKYITLCGGHIPHDFSASILYLEQVPQDVDILECIKKSHPAEVRLQGTNLRITVKECIDILLDPANNTTAFQIQKGCSMICIVGNSEVRVPWNDFIKSFTQEIYDKRIRVIREPRCTVFCTF